MATFHIPFDTPVEEIEDVIYRELQTLHILSIELLPELAVVEVADDCQHSVVLQDRVIHSIPVVEVEHHSALLTTWLPWCGSSTPLTVIHVDSHNDLGRPNLKLHGDSLVDRWTGKTVDPADANSVRRALDSTSIEIGNYLTMALYWLPISHLIWICPAASGGGIRKQSNPAGLRLEWGFSDPIHSRVRRLTVIPVNSRPYDVSCRILKDPTSLLAVLREHPDTKFILDIDLDFFDNSEENASPGFITPDEDSSLKEWADAQRPIIDDLLHCLPLERVVTIGFSRSPGFCPERRAEVLSSMLIDALSTHPRCPDPRGENCG